jgi:hypothetical protein
MIMVSIGEIRALAYRKGCTFDRVPAPAKWRVHSARGALASVPLGYLDAYVLLMEMPDVKRDQPESKGFTATGLPVSALITAATPQSADSAPARARARW